MPRATGLWKVCALLSGSILLAGFAGGVPAQGNEKPSDELVFKPFDQAKFEKHMTDLGVTERQIASFRKNVEEESAKHAVDDLLLSNS